MNFEVGYYKAKFYNHSSYYILYWNGCSFESFPSEETPHDEIDFDSLVRTEDD